MSNTEEKVEKLWTTATAVGKFDVGAMLKPDAAGRFEPEGLRLAELDPAEVLLDPEALSAEFAESFAQLAKADGRPVPDGVDLHVQVWRSGYDLPHAGFAADYVGWCYLAIGSPGVHEESGAVSAADPRAGSAMTAMPGLPWGRQLLIRPAPGNHMAVPGWLTCSVVPVEAGQSALVAFATSCR